MFTISDIFHQYQSKRLTKTERATEPIDHYEGMTAKLPKYTKGSTNQSSKGKKEGESAAQDEKNESQHKEEGHKLPFPDRRKQNIPVILDTRAKRTSLDEEIPVIDISV